MVKEIVQSFSKPYFIPLVITLVMSFGLMAYESVLGLFVDNQFGATPKDIAILVTSTGLISVIIQLFAVDWVVRRFGEAGCFDYISWHCSSRIFTLHHCAELCHVFRRDDDHFPYLPLSYGLF